MTDEPEPETSPADPALTRLDRWFRLYMALLFVAALGGIYLTLFVAEGVWPRVGVFLGLGSLIYVAFMGGVFWFGGVANELGRAARKAREADAEQPPGS